MCSSSFVQRSELMCVVNYDIIMTQSEKYACGENWGKWIEQRVLTALKAWKNIDINPHV